MVSLAEKRRGAEHLEAKHGVSERRACQVIEIARSSKRRPSGNIEEAKVIRRMHELTAKASRWAENVFACFASERGCECRRSSASGVAMATAQLMSIEPSTRTTFGVTTSWPTKRSMGAGSAS